MRTEQSIFTEAQGWVKRTDQNLGALAQLVFLFGKKDLLKQQKHFEAIQMSYPDAEIVGCSTCGDILQDEVISNSIICTAAWFEKSTITIVKELISDMEDSFGIGEKLAAKLDKKDLKHVMILSEGLNVNGSELTKGLNSCLKDLVSVTGGLAGDEVNFLETVIVHNQAGEKNAVVAIGFYGDHLKVGYGSRGGWDSFGVDRLVTRSHGNILYELDEQPALELYKKYLGDFAAELPASAMLFPLSIRIRDAETYLVRTVLSVNEHDGSMVFAGNIPQGEYVRLMKANFYRLNEGASEAAKMSLVSLKDSYPDLAILISCVGRKLVLKQRIEEELESVIEVIGDATTIAGFYSYGEICPVNPFEKHCELHNQTMTITVFKEM
ncbi:MAG: FIST N-terminal domain-containing protein [Bacteroidota bacterium]